MGAIFARIPFVAVTLLVACGGRAQLPTQKGHVEIVTARLQAAGSTIELGRNGRVMADGLPVGTLSSDGRLVADSGSLIATLGRDGRITNATGYVLDDVTIHNNGTMTFQGRQVSVGDGGVVAGLGSGELTIDVEPRGRRAALFVLVVAALSGS